MKREVDMVILSDVHLGTYHCHARELQQYLKSIKPKTLVLNGDFIDSPERNEGAFPKAHMKIIKRVLKMSAKGTKVYYITENQDDQLRRQSDFSKGHIHLRDQLLLQLHGKKYWISHGDHIGLMAPYAPILPRLGDKGYHYLLSLSRTYHQLRQRFCSSFAPNNPKRISKSVQAVDQFEHLATQFAADKGCDFVICGHTHKPNMRLVKHKQRTVTYLNAGDWVEHLTALEYNWGEWRLFSYKEVAF